MTFPFRHANSLAAPPVATVRDLVSLIRTHIQEILHLPFNSPHGLYYCRKRDGIVSVTKLETLSLCTTLKLGTRIIDTAVPSIQAIHTLTNFDYRLGKMAKSIRLPWRNFNEKHTRSDEKPNS
jgi:hypothetical protein